MQCKVGDKWHLVGKFIVIIKQTEEEIRCIFDDN